MGCGFFIVLQFFIAHFKKKVLFYSHSVSCGVGGRDIGSGGWFEYVLVVVELIGFPGKCGLSLQQQ